MNKEQKEQKEKQSITHVPEDYKVVIELYKEFLYEKKDGKKAVAKSPKGNFSYQRHDLMGLQEILFRFNSTLHDPIKEMKNWGRISRKVQNIIIEINEEDEETLKLGLTLEEASFLKEFIEKFNEKDGKGTPPLNVAALYAMPSILEQLK